MDPLSLAAIAAPFVAKGAEAFSKSAGDKLGVKVGELCQAVIDKFKGDSDAEEALALAQKRPDSKGRQSALEEILAEKLKAEPDFAAKVQRLVDELQKEGGSRMAFDQRGQTVHGSQTNIAGNVKGPVFSGQFNGPVASGEAVDMRGSTGAIYKPSGPVNQQYGDRYYSKAQDESSRCEGQRRIKSRSTDEKKSATSEIQTRYLNTFFADKDGSMAITPNKPLIHGQKYVLCVEISPERKGIGEDDQPFPDNILSSDIWKERSSLPLKVIASSRDFEIESRMQGLDLHRKGATATLKFLIISSISQGYGSIMVDVFLRGYLLQSKQVEAWIISTPELEPNPPSQPNQKAKTTFLASDRLAFQDLSQLPERLLTINVERDPDDGSIDFRFLDRTDGERNIAFFDTRLQPTNIDQAISDIRRQLKLMVTGKEGCKGYRWRIEGDISLLNTWLPQLANLGHSFYRAILPEGKRFLNDDQAKELKKALKPGTTIQVNPVLGVITIPWAMLYERKIKYVPDKTKVCDQFRKCNPECPDCPYTEDHYLVCPYAFWGYRYAIEQLPCWTGNSMSNPPALILKIKNDLPLSINLNVWKDFDLWKDHKSNLESIGQVKVHVAELLPEMEKVWKEKGSALDLIYFYCHGGVDDQGPYLEISDCRINSNFLEASPLDWKHNPLVFLNGCATGDYGPKSYISLIEDFRKGGACGVVGTECPVIENFARAYADALFPKFFCGQPLGQAMLNVRLEMLKEKLNPLGLVYTLYAYNNISLATPVAQEAGFGGAA